MFDAAIANRLRPSRAGAGLLSISLPRWPDWPKPCPLEVHQRQQIAQTLERERTKARNAALLSFPLMNGY
jgi:hypothetical protein